jgi:hypothetical protein
MLTVAKITKKFQALRRVMNEKTRRLWAASEAIALGWGGVTRVAAATGMSRNTIRAGIMELQSQIQGKALALGPHRVRRPGGGRKPQTKRDPTLLQDLEALLEPATRGDPQSPLRWTCKSAAKLAAELNHAQPRVRVRTVNHLLKELNYSLQVNHNLTLLNCPEAKPILHQDS